MAYLKIIEGTWKDLAAHAESLQGCRLRLIVLSEEMDAAADTSDETRLQDTAKRLFLEADDVEQMPDKESGELHKDDFGKAVTEKHRRMGLKL